MKVPRRQFLKAGAGTVALLAAGCDRVPRELRWLVAPPSRGAAPFHPGAVSGLDPITHVLNRVGFGPRPGDYQRVRDLAGTPDAAASAWLAQQLQPEKIDDQLADDAARRFETLSQPLGELFEYQPELLHNELMRAALARAVLSERQLYEMMVQFWSDHFNVDPSKGDAKWLKVADDREVIRPHALGKFPDMLRASALSPAMLWYLDGRVNRRSKPSEKPNENYARELLELHTLGVHGGYTQQDVMEVARCLTGWSVRSTEQAPYFQVGKVEFHERHHDFGQKTFLGHTIQAVSGSLPREEPETLGRRELDRVLHVVTTHPATAQHLAAKLCRHFIADDPPAGAVAKVAATFRETSGDIRAVLRTLFATEEFRLSRGCKFKRPFAFIASALRITGANTDAGLGLIDYLRRMGQAPFSYPTPEGYADKAEPWMGTLLWRWNFALALSRNQIQGTRVDFESFRLHAGGDDQLMAHILGRLPTKPEAEAYHQSEAGLALLLACPAFQWC
jgi:uncharacterized protein (DUF1800 family)